MALLALILRAILFLFVFRLAVIVLRAFFGGFIRGSRPGGSGSGGSARRASPKTAGRVEELVRDPVCGVHTARSSAIAGRYQGSTAYFCSQECADKARIAQASSA
jgi:YHS domain-containing protein